MVLDQYCYYFSSEYYSINYFENQSFDFIDVLFLSVKSTIIPSLVITLLLTFAMVIGSPLSKFNHYMGYIIMSIFAAYGCNLLILKGLHEKMSSLPVEENLKWITPSAVNDPVNYNYVFSIFRFEYIGLGLATIMLVWYCIEEIRSRRKYRD